MNLTHLPNAPNFDYRTLFQLLLVAATG